MTSEAYFDAMTRLKRAQSQVTGAVEDVTNDVYRMFNIPAGSDVRKLREQLSRMERRLEAMSKELAKRDAESVSAKSKPSLRSKPRSKPAGKTKPSEEINPSGDGDSADETNRLTR